jgi:hypothetical protein
VVERTASSNERWSFLCHHTCLLSHSNAFPWIAREGRRRRNTCAVQVRESRGSMGMLEALRTVNNTSRPASSQVPTRIGA